jgi:hypothetical protein
VSPHQTDSCDFIDVLEEAVTLSRPVTVQLRDGRRFVDHVRDVETDAGRNWAVFATEGRIGVDDISDCTRAEPIEPSYAGKG